MKVATALEFGRSAQKYGSTATPRSRAHPRYRAEIKEPQKSSSWKKASAEEKSPNLEDLRDVKSTRREEVSRFKDTSVARYEDELGNETYRIEKYTHGSNGETRSVSYEIPLRGKTGMLDGTHPESKKLVLDHAKSDADNVLVMPKLKNLKYINYFQDGSRAGDKMLEAVSKAIKKEVRDEDLSFKLGGADFLMSLKNIKPERLKMVEERINREVARDPAVKQVIRDEVRSLERKQREAVASGDRELAEVLQKRIQEASSFKPDLRFQNLTSEEIGNASSFEQAIRALENKFPKD
ncbi:response regulator PleD [compost metagenome]